MNNSMRSRDVKTLLRNIFLSAMIVLAVGMPQARPVKASGSDDERNIEKLAIRRVQPPYPPLAQKYRIEGVVTVQVTVEGDGKVTKAEFIRGHNIFRSVSLDAAKKWRFKLAGENALEGTIRFAFKLGD